jgi:hypothetical protein
MKKFILAVLLFAPVLLFAQKSYIGINAGVSIPSSPSTFTTYWSTSFNLGLTYEKPVSDMFAIGGELNYATFSLNRNAAGLSSNTTGGSFNAMQLLFMGKITDYYSASNITPYGRAGIGLSFTSFDDIRTPGGTVILAGSSENGLGVMLGAGIDFHLQSGGKISVEGSYRLNNRPGDSFNAFLIDFGYNFALP